jgi:preprotein translocase subunit SecF
MLRILHDTHFDFISRTKVAAIGIAIFLLPALVMIALTGFRSGVEFTGGTLMQIEFKTAQPVSEVRDAIADAGIPNVEIQTFGAPNEL